MGDFDSMNLIQIAWAFQCYVRVIIRAIESNDYVETSILQLTTNIFDFRCTLLLCEKAKI